MIAIPLTGMVLGILGMIRNYSNSYKNIMANLKTANEYNLKFKEGHGIFNVPRYDRTD